VNSRLARHLTLTLTRELLWSHIASSTVRSFNCFYFSNRQSAHHPKREKQSCTQQSVKVQRRQTKLTNKLRAKSNVCPQMPPSLHHSITLLPSSRWKIEKRQDQRLTREIGVSWCVCINRSAQAVCKEKKLANLTACCWEFWHFSNYFREVNVAGWKWVTTARSCWDRQSCQSGQESKEDLVVLRGFMPWRVHIS